MLVPALLLLTLTLGALVLVRRKARPAAPAAPTPRAEYLPAPHFGPTAPGPRRPSKSPTPPDPGPWP